MRPMIVVRVPWRRNLDDCFDAEKDQELWSMFQHFRSKPNDADWERIATVMELPIFVCQKRIEELKEQRGKSITSKGFEVSGMHSPPDVFTFSDDDENIENLLNFGSDTTDLFSSASIHTVDVHPEYLSARNERKPTDRSDISSRHKEGTKSFFDVDDDDIFDTRIDPQEESLDVAARDGEAPPESAQKIPADIDIQFSKLLDELALDWVAISKRLAAMYGEKFSPRELRRCYHQGKKLSECLQE